MSPHSVERGVVKGALLTGSVGHVPQQSNTTVDPGGPDEAPLFSITMDYCHFPVPEWEPMELETKKLV